MVTISPWQFHSFPHNEYVHGFFLHELYIIFLFLSLWDIVSHDPVIYSLLALLFLFSCLVLQ